MSASYTSRYWRDWIDESCDVLALNNIPTSSMRLKSNGSSCFLVYHVSTLYVIYMDCGSVSVLKNCKECQGNFRTFGVLVRAWYRGFAENSEVITLWPFSLCVTSVKVRKGTPTPKLHIQPTYTSVHTLVWAHLRLELPDERAKKKIQNRSWPQCLKIKNMKENTSHLSFLCGQKEFGEGRFDLFSYISNIKKMNNAMVLDCECVGCGCFPLSSSDMFPPLGSVMRSYMKTIFSSSLQHIRSCMRKTNVQCSLVNQAKYVS